MLRQQVKTGGGIPQANCPAIASLNMAQMRGDGKHDYGNRGAEKSCCGACVTDSAGCE
jgi:hypothetical protein